MATLTHTMRQFKVSVDDDVRRFRLTDPVSIMVLQEKVRDLFRVGTNDSVVLRWRDEDDDLITIVDNADVLDVMESLKKVVRLYVTITTDVDSIPAATSDNLNRTDENMVVVEMPIENTCDSAPAESTTASLSPLIPGGVDAPVPETVNADMPSEVVEATYPREEDIPPPELPEHIKLETEQPVSADASSVSKAIHHYVSCDITGMHPLIGVRWHRKGEDFDVCQEAFDKLSLQEKRRYEKITSPGAVPVPFADIVFHPGVECDNSEQYPIEGNRWHRMGKNFDLCEAEFQQLPEHERVGFELITHPGAVPIPYGYPIRFTGDVDPAEHAATLLQTVLTALNKGFDIEVSLIPRGLSAQGPPPSAPVTSSSGDTSLQNDAKSGKLNEYFLSQAAVAAAESYTNDKSRRRGKESKQESKHHNKKLPMHAHSAGYQQHPWVYYGRGGRHRHANQSHRHSHHHVHPQQHRRDGGSQWGQPDQNDRQRSHRNPLTTTGSHHGGHGHHNDTTGEGKHGYHNREHYIPPGKVLPVGTIRLGNQGAGVEQLQRFLWDNNLMQETDTETVGVYGPATASAIDNFERIINKKSVSCLSDKQHGLYNKATRDGLLEHARDHTKRTDAAAVSSPVPVKAQAMYDYNPGPSPHMGQLTLVKGQVVTILDSSKQWWDAVDSNGMTGKVPSNYMEMIENTESESSVTTTPTSITDGIHTTTGIINGANETTVTLDNNAELTNASNTSTEPGSTTSASRSVHFGPEVIPEYIKELGMLVSMGFTDTDLVMPLLQRFDGDISQVLAEICP